jgi:hypothetical protein
MSNEVLLLLKVPFKSPVDLYTDVKAPEWLGKLDKMAKVTIEATLRDTVPLMGNWFVRLEAVVPFQDEQVAMFKIRGYSEIVNYPAYRDKIYERLLKNWKLYTGYFGFSE